MTEESTIDFRHETVLFRETLDFLRIEPQGTYVDGTLGGGGHAQGIAQRLTDGGLLIGIDKDMEAIEAARTRLLPFEARVKLFRDDYRNTVSILEELGIEYVDGIILDLGVSSFQLDESSRGFSYKADAPLDMRMDRRARITAEIILNEYSERELCRILYEYGEEKFARNIAKHIVKERSVEPIATSGRLNEIIDQAIPARVRAKTKGHPAKRTYQALRIECNDELNILESSLDGLIGRLRPGGRLAVITFHSLEDRIVKRNFARNENPCDCPPDFPVCACGKKSLGQAVTKKPVAPSEAEIMKNKRAKSAKLRVFERR